MLKAYTHQAHSGVSVAKPNLHRQVQSLLPLTEAAFEILLALSDRQRHGYAILQEVERRTEGRVSLHPGTLYRGLNRMLTQGWIEELDERPDPEMDDERRRYYRITSWGRAVAAAEAKRLASQVAAARVRKLVSDAEVV